MQESGKPTGQLLTELLVIGTIHHYHMMAPHYTFGHLKAILDQSYPDALCLEITPENRNTPEKTPPQEMFTVGVKWAVDNRRPWYPMDWGSEDVVREIREARRAFEGTPEGKAKIAEVNGRSPHIERIFATSWAGLRRITPLGINNPEFDALAKQEHDLEAEAYGEGPLTSFWKHRNLEMCRLTEEGGVRSGPYPGREPGNEAPPLPG